MGRVVKIKAIHIEGYGSFQKPVSFDFDRMGVNLIKGVNGVGKSTLFDALLWGLYKHTLKKNIATWEDRRLDTFKGTRVVIEVFIGEDELNGAGYMIARHLSFAGNTKGMRGNDSLMLFKKEGISYDELSLKLFSKEDLDGDDLHKKDIQQSINSVLGIDRKTFMASVFFGQRLKGLVESESKDTRQLFENLFELAFVDSALEKAKIKKSELDVELIKLNALVTSEGSTIENTKREIERGKEILATFDKQRDEAISEYESELTIKRLEQEEVQKKFDEVVAKLSSLDLSEYDKLLSEQSTVKLKLAKAKSKVHEEQDRVSGVSREINKAENKKASLESDLKCVKENCPTCSKPLDKKEVEGAKKKIKEQISKEEEIIETFKKELKSNEVEYEKEVVSLSSELDIIAASMKSYQELISTKSELENSKSSLDKQLGQISTYIEHKESQILREKSREKPEVRIEELEAKIGVSERKITETADNILIVGKKAERVGWWVSTGFASKGLKSFVFNAMLNKLNELCYEYAARLGFSVQFNIDMSKASKPFKTTVYMDRKERDYEDFSGGQKQRVDICIAFAMHSLISSATNFNILVMDELFEGLDGEGIG